MIVRRSFSLVGVPAASILLGLVTFGQTAAQDVRHLCSEKYQAAKAAGTLNGDTWPQFYSKCTAEAKGNAAAQNRRRRLRLRTHATSAVKNTRRQRPVGH